MCNNKKEEETAMLYCDANFYMKMISLKYKGTEKMIQPNYQF